MKRHPVVWIVVVLDLVALVSLAFVYPHLMVSPGPLVEGHEDLATDCFACHAAWRGASTQRCIACHVPADIGLRTTRGQPVTARTVRVAFHQDLVERDCMACHREHQGSRLTQGSRTTFSHALLRPPARTACASCHMAPRNAVHAAPEPECSRCHDEGGWRPARFEHAWLPAAVVDRCESCHQPPADRLHRQFRADCDRCHRSEAWRPSTFDHGRHFVLDRDHQASCETCHRDGEFDRYTCYGCHEHTEARVRAKHLEEGVRDVTDCARCHRDPGIEPASGQDGRDGDGRDRRRRDRD